MARTDLTDITLVIDRSGSMASIREDAQGGINNFLDEQAKDADALISLYQFDTEYEKVFAGVPSQQRPEYILSPRGGTALLDAVGKAINETGQRLAAMPESERPGLVMMIIVTDGGENSSREFNKQQIQEMIKHQEDKYNWKFTYLGANQDAFAEAGAMGLTSGTSNYAAHKISNAYQHLSAKVARGKEALMTSSLGMYTNEFLDDEVEDMN